MTKASEDATEAEEVTVEEPEVVESESARYLRIRQAAKAEAAITIEANAKEALKAKQKRLKGAPVDHDLEDFHKRAAQVEKSINSKEED